MTCDDIDRIVEGQGYTLHFDVRITTRRDGMVYSYAYLRKRGLRRPVHLGAMTTLLKMSKANLVSLIKTRTAKSAQSAQKDEVTQ